MPVPLYAMRFISGEVHSQAFHRMLSSSSTLPFSSGPISFPRKKLTCHLRENYLFYFLSRTQPSFCMEASIFPNRCFTQMATFFLSRNGNPSHSKITFLQESKQQLPLRTNGSSTLEDRDLQPTPLFFSMTSTNLTLIKRP